MKKLFLSLIFAVSVSSLTSAATFTVNNNGDTNDANTADNLCADSSGNCTLRAAIEQANLTAGDDIIEFDSTFFNVARTITLTRATDLVIGITPPPPFSSLSPSSLPGAVKINGTGVNLLTIDGGTASNRVFYIERNGNANINDMTITGGNGGGYGGIGGGIGMNGGTLTLNNTIVTANSASNGGGGIGGSGTLYVINTLVSNNTSDGSNGGGGIFCGDLTTITNSIITNNRAYSGGGLSGSGVTIINSTISNNSAGDGGGIYGGEIDLINSVVSNNSSTGNGGGIFSRSFGGAFNIINSTVSGNSTRYNGGGILHNSEGVLNLTNATISNNSVVEAAGGGGIGNPYNSTINSRNTIIADNIAPLSPDLHGTLNSLGNNLIENTSGATITGTATGNIIGQDPKLLPLRNNGGATSTQAIAPNSPAIDSGNNCVVTATCPSNNPPFLLTTDQRGAGFLRQVDGNNDGVATVDIGAFEAIISATVTVGGKVVNANGRGIFGAIVRFTDVNGILRFARTNPFGYYRFNNVPNGNTYNFEVKSKSYTFTPQVLSIVEDSSNLNFVASEGR